MPDCLLFAISIPSLWRSSTGALIKKINDLCFSLPTQRLILNDINNLIDEEPTPDSIYIKNLLTCSINQTYLIALIDSIAIYFDTIETHKDLACQFSSGDIRDLLRFLIFISELIHFNLINKKTSYFSWNLIESFFHCLTKTISNSSSIIVQLLIGNDQITSCCILAKSILSIYEYLFQRHGLIAPSKQTQESLQAYLNLIEPDNRPYTQILIQTFTDLNRLYNLTKKIRFISYFYRKYLHTIAILLFRLPIFNSFIRIPTQFWQQNHSNIKLQFDINNYCLSIFPNDLLQHSDIMSDYIERISYVGWLSRQQFQEIWVTFLGAINSTRNDDNGRELSQDEILENNATQCIWIRGVTTFLLNALRLNSIGNPADRHFEHYCRNRAIPFLSNEQGGKYIETCSTIGVRSKRIFTNLERLVTNDFLSYGQLSYDIILTSIQSNNTSPLPANSLFGRLSRHDLDINSPLQILIEIYVNWLTTNRNPLCLQLKFELIRSFIYLSDLFTSLEQLTNLYKQCNEHFRTWFEEDDLFMSLVSYGLCKSGILLEPMNKESNEIYSRLIERSWKYLSQTSGYSSCLFLLESHVDDINKILVTNLIQELKTDIQTKINPLKFNLDIRVNGLILANLFYLIENNLVNPNEFLPLFFDEECFDTNDYLTQDMISIGLERLLLLGQYPKGDIWKLYKRSITSLRQSTGLNLNQLILVLARIYTYETNQNSNKEILTDEQEMRDTLSMNTSSSLDNILIELVGELYERTKQTYILPYEALLLLRPLPSLLTHMGLSDRLMNKIVVEFAASTQQLYPQILAYIVFAVFRILISSYYSAKVNEWTLLSMTSVAQRKPIRMAIWGLTCLMLSACSSHTIADSL